MFKNRFNNKDYKVAPTVTLNLNKMNMKHGNNTMFLPFLMLFNLFHVDYNP